MRTNRDCRRITSLFTAAAAAAWLGITIAHAQTAPSITQGPASQSVEPGSTVSFSVTAAGTGPFLYQWQFNGSNIAGLITTVAGDGPSSNVFSGSYGGDHGQATNASLNAPWGLALDASNNLYIADWQNSRIRKVAANGIITTLAGTNTTNYSGDGKQAANAGLNYPRGVCVDSLGDVFICDSGNNRIRKVATNGVINTIAGGGTNGLGDGGAATNATLNGPTAAAVDTLRNLFIADSSNNRIRKVGTNGFITTVAGGGTNVAASGVVATNADIPNPVGIAIDLFGNLFVSFANTNSRGGVLEVGTNGIVTLLATNGFYSEFLTNASGLAVDESGDLLIAIPNEDLVLEGARNAGMLPQPVAGILAAGGFFGDGGPATSAELLNPYGVAVDAAGDVFIADTYNNRIRKVAALGPVFSVADVTATNAGNYDVVVSSPSGSVTSTVAFLSVGYPPGVTNQTASETAPIGSSVTLGATATGAGPFLYQWQFNGTNLPILIHTVAGNGQDAESGDGEQATNAALYAGGVGVDNLGGFFIADSANDRVREVNSNGVITTVAGDGTNGFSGDGSAATNAWLNNPVAVAVDGSGNLYIADEGNNRIRLVGTNGVISTDAGNGTNAYSGDGQPATNASLSNPKGVAVDALGNLYIADEGNNRIRQVGTNGVINTIAGNGANGFSGDGGAASNASLSNPAGVAVDGLGNVFIADSGNKRIRKISIDGIIVTVAGNGDAGYYGDGGPATSAFFESPASVAVDAFGNVYIADGTEHVRKVNTNGIISTVAGNAGLGFSGDGGPPDDSMLGEVYGLATDISGDLFIADTGNYRIREISAFGPSLPLGIFNANEAGTYDVIVSNPFGSVTSAPIVLTPVFLPLPPLTVSLFGNNFVTIQFSGTPGSSYVLQVTTNLVPPVNWQPLATNAAGTNGSGAFTLIDTLAIPASFYRLALP
jgi:hypothetical protein